LSRFVILGALMARVEWPLACALICRFGTLDVEIHNHWILPASDDHSLARHIRAGVNFLVRDVRRNVNEIPWRCLIAKLQTITPAHAGTTPHNVDHRFQLAMMVRARFGVRLNNNGTSPQLAGPSTRVRNGGCPRHSRGLGSVGIQFPSVHNLHAVLFPVQVFIPSIWRDDKEYPSTAFQTQVCCCGNYNRTWPTQRDFRCVGRRRLQASLIRVSLGSSLLFLPGDDTSTITLSGGTRFVF